MSKRAWSYLSGYLAIVALCLFILAVSLDVVFLGRMPLAYVQNLIYDYQEAVHDSCPRGSLYNARIKRCVEIETIRRRLQECAGPRAAACRAGRQPDEVHRVSGTDAAGIRHLGEVRVFGRRLEITVIAAGEAPVACHGKWIGPGRITCVDAGGGIYSLQVDKPVSRPPA